MPVNCLIKCFINSDSEQSCSKNQFMVNSWIIHEHSCFKKTVHSSFAFCLLSFVFGSSVAQNGGLSFFNVHSAKPTNSLKTKDLRKRHFWLKILSQWKPLILKTLGANSPNNSSTSPPTQHSTRRRNCPYILRRETLHYVGFHVGFAGQTLHTQQRWKSNLNPALCRICRECMNPLKTV